MTAVAQLVSALRQCEHLAGDLFAAQGELASAMIVAERAHGLSAVTGQRILANLSSSQEKAVGARADLVALHRLLEQLGRHLDIRLEDFGDGGKTPGFAGALTRAGDSAAVSA